MGKKRGGKSGSSAAARKRRRELGITHDDIRAERSTGLSAIIADIRSVAGFDKDQILHSFEIARTSDTHSVCVPLKKSDGGNADLVIRYMGETDFGYFQATL